MVKSDLLMRIVHLVDWYIPNMGYQENFLPHEQKKLGHEVYIITSDRVPNFKGLLNDSKTRIIGQGLTEDRGVIIIRLPCLEYHGKVIPRGLRRKLLEIDPDILQAHDIFSPFSMLALFYKRRSGCKLFIDDHTNNDNFHPKGLFAHLYVLGVRVMIKIFSRRIRLFLPVTYAVQEFLHTKLNIPSERMAIMHLGADSRRFKPSAEIRDHYRTSLMIKTEETLIITSGKFDWCKDIHVLISAFAEVERSYPEVKILLLGSGPKEYMDYLKELVNHLKLSEKIIFRGFVPNDELPGYYCAADIGIWPGDNSIGVFEALGTGLPIIVPNNDLSYRILFDNVAAVGFDRGDCKNLAICILNLLNNKQVCEELSKKGLLVMRNDLSWEVIASRSTQIYLDW